jgi:hypothetical protein
MSIENISMIFLSTPSLKIQYAKPVIKIGIFALQNELHDLSGRDTAGDPRCFAGNATLRSGDQPCSGQKRYTFAGGETVGSEERTPVLRCSPP